MTVIESNVSLSNLLAFQRVLMGLGGNDQLLCVLCPPPSPPMHTHFYLLSLDTAVAPVETHPHTHAHTHIHIHTLAAVHHFGLFLRETQIPLRKIDKTQRCDATHGEKETPESR